MKKNTWLYIIVAVVIAAVAVFVLKYRKSETSMMEDTAIVEDGAMDEAATENEMPVEESATGEGSDY